MTQLAVVRTNTLVQRERSSLRVFILDPGSAYQASNGSTVVKAGFQVHWCTRFPPIEPNAPFPGQLVPELRAEIDNVQPHVMLAVSKAAVYAFNLWQAGCWHGPTVLVNPHPVCQQLPAGSSMAAPRRTDRCCITWARICTWAPPSESTTASGVWSTPLCVLMAQRLICCAAGESGRPPSAWRRRGFS